MNLKKILFIFFSIFFILYGNVTLAASCQCTVRNAVVPLACEQKSEDECYAQVDAKKTCALYTDDQCKVLKNVVAPGLLWSERECRDDKPPGIWAPPNQSTTLGPYCFEQQDFDKPFRLSIDILDVNKTGIKNIGQYVNLVYKLVVGLAIFFGIIMLTVAGFRWLTAGGNTGKIGESKKMIFNAIIGLLIAAGAYTILQTINPRLLELHLPLIPKIKTINYLGITTCDGYENLPDCESNPIGLNSGISAVAPVGYSGNGCMWNGSDCVQAGQRADGDLGGNCLKISDQYSCNTPNLKCVATAGFHLCTDGSANSVCGNGQENDGCQPGLTCGKDIKTWWKSGSTSIASICYKLGENQPQGTPCSGAKPKVINGVTINECATGVCEAGHCTIGQCDPNKCPTGQICLFTKTSKFQECGRPTTCYRDSNCPDTYGSDSFCPAELLNQAKTDYQKNYANGAYKISQPQNQSAYSICQYKLSAGAICGFDDECKSGACVNKQIRGTKEQGVCK